MAELNPITLWRRLWALPADSRGKTLAVAFAVSAVSAVAVTAAYGILEPRIAANREAEVKARLESMIASLPALESILANTGADTLRTEIVNLDTGQPAGDISPEGFDMVKLAEDPATSTEIPEGEDIAGIGRRPDYAQIHLLTSGDTLDLAILPVYGTGYQSRIRAYLALEGDLNTVAGFVVTEQAETPGLGAKITEASWQSLWPGRKIAGPDGEIRLSVVRGTATTEYEVDGITGATRTSNAVGNIVRFWMGPYGYGPLLDTLRAGGVQ